MKMPGTSVTSVTAVCDKSICRKSALTMPQGEFSEMIRTFVTSVTVSQGSRFTMEYISIERVTRPRPFPNGCDKSDKSPFNDKTGILDPLKGDFGQYFCHTIP